MDWGLVFKGVGAGISLFNSISGSDAARDQARVRQQQISGQAAANRRVSNLDAGMAERRAVWVDEQTRRELADHADTVEAVLSRLRAGYGKAGVVTNTGSPLAAMSHAARNMEREAAAIAIEGEQAAREARDRARRYRMLAKNGLRDAAYTATLVEQAADARAAGAYLAAGSTVFDFLGKIAS